MVGLDNLESELPEWLPVSAEALGWFIARLPVDYFSPERRHPVYSEARHPLIGWSLVAAKNLLGALLITLGLLMLLTPGQGVLTILIGMLLVNFPGKYRLERWVVTRPGVLRTLNRFRARVGRLPLDPP